MGKDSACGEMEWLRAEAGQGGKEPGPQNRVSQSYSSPLLLRWEGEKIADLEMRACLKLLTGGSLEIKEVKAALSEFS